MPTQFPDPGSNPSALATLGPMVIATIGCSLALGWIAIGLGALISWVAGL